MQLAFFPLFAEARFLVVFLFPFAVEELFFLAAVEGPPNRALYISFTSFVESAGPPWPVQRLTTLYPVGLLRLKLSPVLPGIWFLERRAGPTGCFQEFFSPPLYSPPGSLDCISFPPVNLHEPTSYPFGCVGWSRKDHFSSLFLSQPSEFLS